MENSNSRNFKLIVLMALVVVFIFGYVVVSNSFNHTISTDVKGIRVEG